MPDEPDLSAPEPESSRGVLGFLKELPVLLVLAFGIALLLKAFLVQAFYIPSGSMQPTLDIGDRVLVSKVSYRLHAPRRGDVIVFRESDAPQDGGVLDRAGRWIAELFGLPSDNPRDLIKRIVALPGETVELRDGDVFVNDRKVAFTNATACRSAASRCTTEPQQIPDGQYFVLGDNRENSQDSRFVGAIPRSRIVGRAFVVIWPPGDWRGL